LCYSNNVIEFRTFEGGDVRISGQSVEPASSGESLEEEVSQMKDTSKNQNIVNAAEIAPVVRSIAAASWVSFDGQMVCSVRKWAEMSIEERAELRRELMDY
jgi:hypothetical protein